MKKKELFTRYPHNPLLRPKDIPYPVNAVFNAGATRWGEKTLLLLRVEDRRGISHFTTAVSEDGLRDWVIDDKPTLLPDPDLHPEEEWGIEDPRITFMEDKKEWVIAYTAYSRRGPLVSLATTCDFRHFNRIGPVLPPENKDAALFPRLFHGRYIMLHRPVPAISGAGAHIWISVSPDLKHWGGHSVLLPARDGGWWDAGKIGICTPPLETEEGWLVLYHGVKVTASGCLYRLGLALLDLYDPSKVIARGEEWVFAPEEPYELLGDVDKVVFPCGWICQGDEIRLYYGGGDKCIALAFACLSEVIGWLKSEPRNRLTK